MTRWTRKNMPWLDRLVITLAELKRGHRITDNEVKKIIVDVLQKKVDELRKRK